MQGLETEIFRLVFKKWAELLLPCGCVWTVGDPPLLGLYRLVPAFKLPTLTTSYLSLTTTWFSIISLPQTSSAAASSSLNSMYLTAPEATPWNLKAMLLKSPIPEVFKSRGHLEFTAWKPDPGALGLSPHWNTGWSPYCTTLIQRICSLNTYTSTNAHMYNIAHV